MAWPAPLTHSWDKWRFWTFTLWVNMDEQRKRGRSERWRKEEAGLQKDKCRFASIPVPTDPGCCQEKLKISVSFRRSLSDAEGRPTMRTGFRIRLSRCRGRPDRSSAKIHRIPGVRNPVTGRAPGNYSSCPMNTVIASNKSHLSRIIHCFSIFIFVGSSGGL